MTTHLNRKGCAIQRSLIRTALLDFILGLRRWWELLRASQHCQRAPTWTFSTHRASDLPPSQLHWEMPLGDKQLGFEADHRLIIAPDKSILRGDYLVDDQTEGRGQERLAGTLFHFGSAHWPNWGAHLGQ